MRIRLLTAVLPALPLVLSGCAETAQRGQQVVSAAEGPPIEDLCSGGSHCLSRYYMFSSEAFGTGGLTNYYSSLERWERYLRSERPEEQCPPSIGGGFSCYAVVEEAERTKKQREGMRRFVAGWLAAYPSEKEAYLAIAAAALDRAWGRYCNDVPLRALDAARVGETWTEMADRVGMEAADRALAAGELLPEPDWHREVFAQRIEGRGGYDPALVAPGYENAGESLLTAMSCEGGGR